MPALAKTRIVIVDDSAVIRGFLRWAIDCQDDMSVVGDARDGSQAVKAVADLDPDLVVMDIDMPVMNGLTALAMMRADRLRLPAVIFSANASLQAPRDDAQVAHTRWLDKPSTSRHADGRKELRNDLVGAIRELVGGPAAPHSAPPGGGREKRTVRPAFAGRGGPAHKSFGVVAIGSSTGGPDALARVLADFPSQLPAPVVVVQHMPASFIQPLANRLDACCQLKVGVAMQGEVLEPGRVYLAPGDRHLLLERDGQDVLIRTDDGPRMHGCRPAVDPLFCSAAEAYDGKVLAVVLTGMGDDGAAGASVVREAGGRIIIQDEATCVVWGMPRAIHDAGLADETLAIGDVGHSIGSTQFCAQRQSRVTALKAAGGRPDGKGQA